MDERRKNMRNKVIFGAVASADEKTRDCVVRDMSDDGARVEFEPGAGLSRNRPPRDQLTLSIARKGRSFLAKVIWWRDNIVGVAFTDEPVTIAPPSDLEERLRKSEKKKRELQNQIRKLLGQ